MWDVGRMSARWLDDGVDGSITKAAAVLIINSKGLW
jgi:hypothetical protein